VKLADLAPYYAVIVATGATVTALVSWRRGMALGDRASACLSVAIVLAFDYWDARGALGALTHDTPISMAFLWIVLIGGVVVVTARLAKRFPRIQLVMLAAGLAMLVPSLAASTARRGPAAARPPDQQATELKPASRSRPSVYFFLLDAYGRTDRLRQHFGFDNSAFVDRLRARGFVSPPRSQAAYGVTGLSAPSILDMNYPAGAGQAGVQDTGPAQAGNNAVVSAFRSLGYSFALAPSELFAWGCHGYEDVCVHPTHVGARHLHVSELTWEYGSITVDEDP